MKQLECIIPLTSAVEIKGDSGEVVLTIESLQFQGVLRWEHLADIRVCSFADWNHDELLQIAGQMCGQPDIVMEEIDSVDILRIGETVMKSLEAGVGGSGVFDTLVFPEKLKWKHFKGIPTNKQSHKHMIKICSRLTGKNEQELGQMTLGDFSKAIERINGFLVETHSKVGTTGSP